MISSDNQQRRSLALLEATPAWAKLVERDELADIDLATSILEAAGRLSDEQLSRVNPVVDRKGCQLNDGKVAVPREFRELLKSFADGEWIGLDLPTQCGGLGLPLVLQAASQQLLDRGCVSFTMLIGASRAGALLLHEYAPAEVAEDWIPAVLGGARTLTICISEAEAGSDLSRIRTRARRQGDRWHVTGQKMWTSFGDHDLTDRIGHCVLARTSDEPGTRSLSLFLVPNLKADLSPNGVTTLGIESKLGLHASPTCSMEFADAEAILLGKLERGLPQLFVMIEQMRLQTGCQGLGIASLAVDVAEHYARERRQGGRPDLEPVPIISHPDVQRQIRILRASTEVLRAAILELAANMDLARGDGPQAEAIASYTQFLMPLIKNFGAEIGFDVASGAIQVLGGAGYTRDWPLEQALRDARIFSIYEGTTGMQGLDFLERRLLRDRKGFDAFIDLAKAAGRDCNPIIERFEQLGKDMISNRGGANLHYVADDWLRAGWLALTAMLGPRLASCDPDSAQTALAGIEQRFAVHENTIRSTLMSGRQAAG